MTGSRSLGLGVGEGVRSRGVEEPEGAGRERSSIDIFAKAGNTLEIFFIMNLSRSICARELLQTDNDSVTGASH